MADGKRLFGLKAVVTGADSGIGEAIVRTLIKQGCEVLAIDSANSGIESHFKTVKGVRGVSVDLNTADAATRVGALAESELGELLGIQGKPLLVDIVRWRGRMPQYHVGHVQLVDSIESLVEQHPGLELAGNAYRGVGIGCCIHSAQSAAERLVAQSRASQ